MPVGVITCCSSVFLGGILGAAGGRFLPQRMADALTLMFGMSAMAIGISAIVQISALPAVILSILLGTAIGEGIDLERMLEKACGGLKGKLSKPGQRHDDGFVERYISIVVLFCFSGTGIMGAMGEGMTGDPSILLAKSILDFFTAGIFAAGLGYMVSLIAFPQVVFLLLWYFMAELIMPLTTPAMIGDFMAVGGIITLAAGFRIARIKAIRVTNLIPAMLLVLPVSWLWTRLMG